MTKTISLPKDLHLAVQQRVDSLNMKFSQYAQKLFEQDLARSGPIVYTPKASIPAQQPPRAKGKTRPHGSK